MSKSTKKLGVFALVFIASALLVVAFAPDIKAQSTATVTIMTAVGGTATADPAGPTYSDGTQVTLTATPDSGFLFSSWTIVANDVGTSDLDNPATLTVSDGTNYTVQAIFTTIQLTPGTTKLDLSTDAIVVVEPAVGGTTNPAPGTYALANAVSLNLVATADNGWKFDHWVIGGVTGSNPHGSYSFTDTPTDNPYNVNHSYGNTYSYQPVFVPTSASTSPSPTVPEFSGLAAIGLVVALLVGVFGYKLKMRTQAKTTPL